MAKLKVTVNPGVQSGDITKDEIMALANANTPPDVTPTPDIIRDANGKVVTVYVNLPDSASENAKNAIEGNKGVSAIQNNVLTLLNDDLSSLSDGDTGFTLNSLQAVGGLEISNKYDSNKGSNLYPSGSVGSMRFSGNGNQSSASVPKVENFFTGNAGHFTIIDSNFGIAYDSLKIGLKVFFESPHQDVGDITDENIYIRTSHPTADAHDFFNSGEDRLKINLGMIELILESQSGATLWDAQDGKRILKAKIGNSLVQTVDLGYCFDEWVEISGEYSGNAGTGQISVTIGGNTTILNFSNLSGLLISSRSANEFRFENSSLSQTNNLSIKSASFGPLAGLAFNNNTYIDVPLLQVTNIVGV